MANGFPRCGRATPEMPMKPFRGVHGHPLPSAMVITITRVNPLFGESTKQTSFAAAAAAAAAASLPRSIQFPLIKFGLFGCGGSGGGLGGGGGSGGGTAVAAAVGAGGAKATAISFVSSPVQLAQR
jgi:hypothetical protein